MITDDTFQNFWIAFLCHPLLSYQCPTAQLSRAWVSDSKHSSFSLPSHFHLGSVHLVQRSYASQLQCLHFHSFLLFYIACNNKNKVHQNVWRVMQPLCAQTGWCCWMSLPCPQLCYHCRPHPGNPLFMVGRGVYPVLSTFRVWILTLQGHRALFEIVPAYEVWHVLLSAASVGSLPSLVQWGRLTPISFQKTLGRWCEPWVTWTCIWAPNLFDLNAGDRIKSRLMETLTRYTEMDIGPEKGWKSLN